MSCRASCDERKFACLQRQKPAMFAQMPLLVYRHFTGSVCTASSDGCFGLFSAYSTAAFSLASGLSNSSDMVRSPTSRSRAVSIGRLFSAPNSKLFAWTTVAIVGAWHAPGRRLEPHARLCVAVAQVVKVQAGCVTNSSSQSCSATASCPCCRHNNQISVVIEPGAEVGWPVQRTSMLR